MSLYNKYKRKREGDEDAGDYKIYKKRCVPGYFQYTCELLANDEKVLYKIFKQYPSIFTRHYKSLERIVYELDTQEKTTAGSYMDLWYWRSWTDGMGRQGQVSELI
jgi:hypothetical protein